MSSISILSQDIDFLSKQIKDLNCFDNKSIFITGGTGLLGSLLVSAIANYAKSEKKSIKLILLVRDLEKAKNQFSSFDNIHFVVNDLSSNISYSNDVDYIFHFACSTASKDFIEKPVDTISSIVDGTRHILEFARKKKVKSVVFLSSLEVYGIPFEQSKAVTENDTGYLNPLSVRSSYSEGKRLAENLCVAYYNQYQVPVKIARLCQTFGAGVTWKDNRVFADFAKKIIKNEDIVLKTTGKTLRNYCYTVDAIWALLIILHKGEMGEAYNVANKHFSLTIREMAEYFTRNFSKFSRVIMDTSVSAEKLGYNPEVRILLDTTKLESLGWEPSFDVDKSFQRLVSHLSQTM